MELRCVKSKVNKKPSYRRDSARRQSLRRSVSFKVTNVSTDRKLVCDFLLVKLTSYFAPLSSHRSFVKLPLLTKVCLSLTHSFSVITLNIAINHNIAKS